MAAASRWPGHRAQEELQLPREVVRAVVARVHVRPQQHGAGTRVHGAEPGNILGGLRGK